MVAEVAGSSERFTFSHALFQHTLYEELSSTRRGRIHRRIGELLEADCGADPGERILRHDVDMRVFLRDRELEVRRLLHALGEVAKRALGRFGKRGVSTRKAAQDHPTDAELIHWRGHYPRFPYSTHDDWGSAPRVGRRRARRLYGGARINAWKVQLSRPPAI